MSEATTASAGVQTDDIDITSLMTWGTVSVVLTVAIMLGLYGLYNSYSAEQRREKTYDVQYAATSDEKQKQIQILESPARYLDSEGKILAVPISRAKELTLKEFAGKE